MIVTLNPVFQSISGRLGNIVYYSAGGVQYGRRYVIPRNPDTNAQRTVRRNFASAVAQWQKLPFYKKEQWNGRARTSKTSGYNHFLSRYLRIRDDAAAAALLCHKLVSCILREGLSVSPADLLYCCCEPLVRDNDCRFSLFDSGPQL